MHYQRHLASIQHLVRDTFRQAWASGVGWMMLTVTGVAVLLCLSVSISGDTALRSQEEPPLFLPAPSPLALAPSVVAVLASSGPLEAASMAVVAGRTWISLEANPDLARQEGIDTVGGRLTLAFGAISIPVARERGDSVRFLELILAGGLAGTLGILLALVWTAGFLPGFLESSAASVLLAKPEARGVLLLGKYLGVVVFVAFQAILFVILTWLALGLRTQVWDVTYWCCIPLLILQFAIFYSFSVLLAVLTHSTVACVFGSLLFWLLAWGINYGAVLAQNRTDAESFSRVTVVLADAAYWVSPKPIDAGLILFDALDAGHDFEKPMIFQLLQSWQAYSPAWSILSSLVITCVLLALSAHEFRATDY